MEVRVAEVRELTRRLKIVSEELSKTLYRIEDERALAMLTAHESGAVMGDLKGATGLLPRRVTSELQRAEAIRESGGRYGL